MLVFDPFGWAAFGPLKWAVISTLALAAAATMWLRSFRHNPPTTIAWAAFLAWGAVCASFGLDPAFSAVAPPLFQNAGVNQEGRQIDQLVASSDLVSWSVTPSSELASGGLYQLLAGSDEVLVQGYEMNGGLVTLLGSR